MLPKLVTTLSLLVVFSSTSQAEVVDKASTNLSRHGQSVIARERLTEDKATDANSEIDGTINQKEYSRGQLKTNIDQDSQPSEKENKLPSRTGRALMSRTKSER